jgi:hypothetical protein
MENMQELINSTRGFLRVHVATGVADRTPLPDFLYGLLPDSLVNLEWADPALGVGEYAWLPPFNEQPAPFDPATHTTTQEGETLVADLEAGVVRVTPGVRPLTVDEIKQRADELKETKDALVKSVDDFIAGIYSKWMRFEAEYKEREAAARAFAAGGYNGDPSVWVASFATSAGKTPQQAADLIILQADGLRTALENLGALRMTKYSIQSAASAEAAQAVRDSIIAQATAIAAAL